MRTRETSYWDYGISLSESKELLETCRNADKKTELKLLQAAQESCEECASSLFISLRNDLSYEDVCIGNNLYVGKGDFYGYRRKTLYLLKEKLMEDNEEVIERWYEDGYIRRYLTIEKAVAETMIDECKLLTYAKKANAVLKIGRLYRINMIALYDYLDAKHRGE